MALMLRSLSAAVVVAAAAAVVAAMPACDAKVEESCTAGSCGGAEAHVNTGTGTGTDTGPDATKCPATPQTGDFPCDVFAVIHKNCNPCHQNPPMGNAPFPLLTYADTQKEYAPGFLTFQQMWVSTGPTGDPRMPFGGMLQPADYDLLHGWLGMCAPPVPAGTGCGCAGEVNHDGGPGCD